MSEIDIEKKESGGIPWWLWLLGALILAGLIWYAIAGRNTSPTTAVATTDNSALVADANATDVNAADSNMADVNSAMEPATDTNAMADANAATSNGMMDQSMSNSAPGNSTVPSASNEAITNILSVVDAKDPAELYGKNVKLLGAPVQAAGTKAFWIGPSFEQKMLVVTDDATNMNGINTEIAQRDRVNIEGKIQQITDFADAKTKYNLDEDAVTFLTNKKILLMATSVSRDKN